MRLKKNWLTLVMAGVLAALLVSASVGWAGNAVEPVKKNVVQAGEDNLTPRQIKDDTGGGKSGKITDETKKEVPGESAIIFGKIHQDGTREVVKVFKGEPQLNITAVFNKKTGEMEFIAPEKTAGKNNPGGYAVLSGPNGEKEVIKEGKGPIMVRTYQDEAGNFKTERKEMTQEELESLHQEIKEKAAKTVIITPETKLPVNEKTDQYLLKADKISEPANTTPATIWHEARADNYRSGWYAEACSINYDGGAGAESDGTSVRAWYW